MLQLYQWVTQCQNSFLNLSRTRYTTRHFNCFNWWGICSIHQWKELPASIPDFVAVGLACGVPYLPLWPCVYSSCTVMEIRSVKDFVGTTLTFRGSRDFIGHVAIQYAVPDYATLEPNRKWIGWPVAKIRPFEILPWSEAVHQYSLLWCHLAALRKQRARVKKRSNSANIWCTDF